MLRRYFPDRVPVGSLDDVDDHAGSARVGEGSRR